ncbi:IS110 family transposase [Gordonia sp. PP30]|uniref:IS110 family transposase n=1 Tax=Gordonia sp. PP30 TaxID=2935861 RepID=UPI001FFEA483|nr:IS110 family transposase [Gordonia sp. PP30]UQE75313.1 IS110 family transposase [Gordonia sp. PP30]
MAVIDVGRNIAGIDTHKDTLHVAVITPVGGALADREFPATSHGYREVTEFLDGHDVGAAGVECTSSYGMGITRVLHAAGLSVAEVYGGRKDKKRIKGKSDPLDAVAAARAVLAGDGIAIPKDERTNMVRTLHLARRSGVKARTAAINQIKAILIGAPVKVREKYSDTTVSAMVTALAGCRPHAHTDQIAVTALSALKTLAKRVQFLDDQDRDLTDQIDVLVTEMNPALRAAYGVGPDTAAQLIITAGANPERLRSEASFAALCGAAPVPASSGKTSRHRLSRGGDRAANNALHRIALVRMSSHQPTRDWVSPVEWWGFGAGVGVSSL